MAAALLLGIAPCALLAQSSPAPSLPSAPQPQFAAQAAAQAVPQSPAPPSSEAVSADSAIGSSVWGWKGIHVDRIEFEGVTFDSTDTLPSELAQKAGQPFDPDNVRSSTRRLFGSGRYRDITVRGVRTNDGMVLIFTGVPRYFVGRVTITGVKSDRLSSLLEYGTKLTPGRPYTDSSVSGGSEGIKDILRQYGYYESKVFAGTTLDKVNSQIDVVYDVEIGRQARVGEVAIDSADLGMTVEQFRKKAKIKQGSKVSRDTVSNALSRLRKQYQKNNRLEATVSMQKQTYVPSRGQVDYEFKVNQGPAVKVLVEGAKISGARLHLLVPIFEEGTIDNDLLNEGVHNLRDFVQQQGYFDAKVDVRQVGQGTADESVIFVIDRGIKHKVLSVDIAGNHYFSDGILRELMNVKKADAYQRSGRYSPVLVQSDVSAIEALYRANGFDQADVKTKVTDSDVTTGKPGKITVVYTVEEGPQKKFGKVTITGVDPSRMDEIKTLMNTQEGQPFSLVTVSGDRDTVLSYYLSHGFDQALVEVQQHKEAGDATRTDVALQVQEGPQVFVNHVLLSGLNFTRPKVVDSKITMHPGDPLDQSALLQTQRNLYDLALFNEVITAVQNPAGDAPRKNTLVQITEAKRWNVTYGFGFEAQTGNPGGTIQTNSTKGSSTEGRAGVSPRVSLDVSRINLRGSEDSLTLHSTYGLLEQIAILTFQNPHLLGAKNVAASVSGGYTNIQNITTFASSTLQGDFRITQKWKRTDTFIYDALYRRVEVDPNSLRVSQDLIPLLSQPVRVAGPGLTWFHDTRQPSPLNASKGFYSTIQTFLASSKFGSQTNFWRIDGSYSTYYSLFNHRYVFARSTRIGYEKAWGANPNAGNAACEGVLLTTNPSCNTVPLPERLYAGGATSHRGFGINAAGPRDLQTGYPVGGSAAFVNTFELRMPPPTLPYVGDSVSFVLFHDMGNVFQNPKDMFPSFLRFRQPNRGTCRDVSGTIGTCSFNYFSHAVGLGARYRTPVGPIRVDFSYNLNPPIYPAIDDYNGDPPHLGRGDHFNFFFSIGQSF
ncbi:MAG: POTRA domain-containing protein [Edaphobacter sp.]|uniref:POTRA domain-containing protein n=1 Tax=Edaphobacter sp. TaxID=1934404 RepID=UPI0023833D3D|nr:POTRA domain-containing protein [Edaphobacter sp.]MDE1177621.1 POTRA domain-containing protein [Edaphobacter sp.]